MKKDGRNHHLFVRFIIYLFVLMVCKLTHSIGTAAGDRMFLGCKILIFTQIVLKFAASSASPAPTPLNIGPHQNDFYRPFFTLVSINDYNEIWYGVKYIQLESEMFQTLSAYS